jgi:glycosyltransferase involved in cell wall biosynthesis
MKKLHMQYSFDIVHFHNDLVRKSFIFALMSIKRSLKIPMISYICLQPTMSISNFVEFLKLDAKETCSKYNVTAFTPTLLTRFEFDLVDRIIVSSNYLKEKLQKIGIANRKLHVIHPFINIEELADRQLISIDPNRNFILYTGSTYSIRLGGYLDALSLVKREKGNFKAVFVSSHFTKRFLRKVRMLNLQKVVTLIPANPKIDLLNLMKTAKVFVYPGYSSMASIDPPLTIIEAMAFKVPIVSSDTGGIPEIVKNRTNCALVQPFNYKKMASALINFLESTNAKTSDNSALNLTNSEFDSRVATKHFVSVYESAIGCMT